MTSVRMHPHTSFVPQNRRKDDAVSSNVRELESISKESNLKQSNAIAGEEKVHMKQDGEQEHHAGFIQEVLNCPLLNCS